MDSILIAVISGITGGLIYQVFVWFFYLLGLAKVTPLQLGAYTLINPNFDITTFPAQLLGAVQHFSLSSLLALIIVYLLYYVGTDYILIKGLVSGAIIYFLVYGGIAKFLIPVTILQPDLLTNTIFLFGHLIFGLTVIFVAAYYIKLKEANR